MTLQYTYSGDPSQSDLQAVRFLLGDTTKATALFDDREIEYQITQTPNLKIAAAELLEIKASSFSRQADIRVGDVSKSFSKAADGMKKCAMALRNSALNSAVPFFGGLTRTGKQALAEETDDVQPQFSIGQNDDPAVVQLNGDVSNLFGLVGPSGI